MRTRDDRLGAQQVQRHHENPVSAPNSPGLTAAPVDASPPRRPRIRRGFRLALLFLLYLPVFAVGQLNARVDPRIVQAAFLRNFAHYVTWPGSAFADDRSPWRICILGDDPFGDALEAALAGRTEQGRPFAIHRGKTLARSPQCQIVYVAYAVSENRRAALDELKDKPVLTVSNAPGFLQEGGIIRFQVTDYVEMSVNLDQARAASLTIQTKMLEVSKAVLENGVIRRVR